MKRSFYRKTERVSPSPVAASDFISDSYEQAFPGYEDDFLYFTGSYPAAVRTYVLPVRAAFDKLEYDGSILFDRYPDRVQFLRLADELLQEGDSNRDLLVMLMLHEFMRRRERYRRRQRL